MPAHICVTCGTQFPESAAPPDKCPICTDERQFVPRSGQAWTTLDAMRWSYRNSFRQYEPALLGVGTIPEFGIRQRALLLRAPTGNVLWDCITFIDDATVSLITALGGISAIAISHPHYYGAMVEWSQAFGSAPIYLHEGDQQWVMRRDPVIHFWSGDRLELSADLTLINAGGHFEGGTVMHWRSGAAGRGALLAGDIVQVVPDFRWVSFMRSYPNYVPLAPAVVRCIVQHLAPFSFERVYGAWWDAVVTEDGKASIARSAERYVAAVTG
jgi:hypothetical protein